MCEEWPLMCEGWPLMCEGGLLCVRVASYV